MMFNRVSEWLDVVLETDIPNEVVAFGFNLYEDGYYNWSMELIGASEFDIDNEDWLCNEVTDFNTRDNSLRWRKEAGWEEILTDIVCALKEYLRKGKYADILKTKSGVGVGFVDGNIEILYAKMKEKNSEIARQNIDANGEMLASDFVSFCIPCEQEVQDEPQTLQNEILKAEKHIVSPGIHDFHDDSVIKKNRKKTIDIRLITVFIVIMALIILLCWGLMINSHRTNVPDEAPQLTEDFEEETSMPSKQEKTESGQIKWQVYIQPDMPEPFIEVLRQYEEFMNADKQDLNDEDVREKIDSVDGKWRYLYDELCGMWMSAAWYRGEEDVIRYSLKDLTGDGYPELVMGYYLSNDTISPQVVYYYSQTEGIRMECLSRYYTMVLYEDGVIVYISGGVPYTETYIQFQEETANWQLVARVVVDWDFETDSVRGYYWGDDVRGNLTDNRSMSVEEYQEIIAQYATEPMELEWTPLILSPQNL